MAKQMTKEKRDITSSNCLNDLTGKLIVSEQNIKDMLKPYMAKLMNEDNNWDNDTFCEIKEGAVDCMRAGEVAKALEKMKKHKAPGLSVVVTEMLQATGNWSKLVKRIM